jgi:hypothetical protein
MVPIQHSIIAKNVVTIAKLAKEMAFHVLHAPAAPIEL